MTTDTHSEAPSTFSPAAPVSSTCIRHITLQQFRNYRELWLQVEPSPAVLIGANGSGKTNILEAISFFAPGRGLRRARLADITCRHAEQGGWSASLRLERNGEPVQLGTGVEISETGNEKRLVRIDGDTMRSQDAFLPHLSLVWMTPQMAQMFGEGQSVRRRFLDRLVYSFDHEHASRVYAYEHSMRERNRLLSSSHADPAWLAVLEQKMAGYSTAIAAARVAVLDHLALPLAETPTTFPKATLELQGDAEQLLADGMQAVDVEEALAHRLAAARRDDGRSGRSSVGAHRSRLFVWYHDKEMEAEFCSTGEQKALLLSIILAHARARTLWQGTPPILLLDEVVAHLDESRRKELFAELESLGAQAWMTGTDAADFGAMPGHFQTLHVSEGMVCTGRA